MNRGYVKKCFTNKIDLCDKIMSSGMVFVFWSAGFFLVEACRFKLANIYIYFFLFIYKVQKIKRCKEERKKD